MKTFLVIVMLSVSCCLRSAAQDCTWAPADCPDEDDIANSQSRSDRLDNGLLPQEIAMQNSMRDLVAPMMYRAARALHWTVMELDEVTNLDPLQSAGTPYNLRSPRFFGIAFQFIVNKDSLSAWRNWIQDINDRYANAGSGFIKSQQDLKNDPNYRQANDSMHYYLNLRLDYINKHPAGHYSNDKKYVFLQKKQNYFLNKVQAIIQAGDKSTGNEMDQLDREKYTRTIHYFNSTLLQVFFGFNDNMGLVNSDNSDPQARQLTVPGATIAVYAHLAHPEPDNSLPWHFTRWKNMHVLLLGNWIKKPVDQNYDAVFTRNGQADEHTPKKIKSDKVQTITIHVMGQAGYYEKILPFINIPGLNKVIINK